MGGLFISSLSTDPRFFFGVLITVIVSITLHELAHGFAALRLGDDTPEVTGHMTLNPLVHMGGLSLVMLAIAGIAWGAMPVDRTRLRGRYAESLVAIAGPATNFLLAGVAIVGLGLWERLAPLNEASGVTGLNGRYLLLLFGLYNVLLAVFNLLPVPPLDGSRVVANFVPAYERALSQPLAQGVMMAVFFAIFMGAGRIIVPWAMNVTTAALAAISGLPAEHFYMIFFSEPGA
ncbi:MAG TPA: site-2 protease family protein [Tepidisphaeraceae bacterium]|jgi:Zn-dependent protease